MFIFRLTLQNRKNTEKKLGREEETTKLKILDFKNAEFVHCNHHMFFFWRNKKYFCCSE